MPGITHPYLNVGRIEGGTNTNVVPGKVVFKLDRRMIPEENPVEVEAEHAPRDRRCRGRSCAGHHGRDQAPAAGQFDEAAAGQQAAGRGDPEARRRACSARPIPAMGTPLYTDVRLYGEAGIPGVIYGAGPRTVLESHAKRADERLELEDLRRATKVVARTLLDLLQ